MTTQMLFATLWVPSLNPVGEPSIRALCLGASAIVLTENWKRFRPKLLTPVLIMVVPLVLFGFIYGSPVPIAAFPDFSLSFPWQYRTFPDADDFCANYIYLAFALVISLRIWRFSSVPFRILGTLESLFFGSIGAMECLGLLNK